MRRVTIAIQLMLVAGGGGVAVAQVPDDDEADPDEGGEVAPPDMEPEGDPIPPTETPVVAEPEPAPVVEPKPEPEPPSWAQLIEVHGFASFGYTLNANQPDDDANDFRVFDLGHNNMTLDGAELTVMHAASQPDDVGFRFDFVVGSTLPLAASSGLGKISVDDGAGGTIDVPLGYDVQQAYVTWVAPAGDAGLKIEAGKFVTWAGAEVIEGWDGYNDNYSRGFLFGYAIPFGHVGIRAGYPVSDQLTISGQVTNGWDVGIDNNGSKSWGLNAAFIASETVAAYVTYLGGAEQAGSTNLRNLIDAVAVIKVGDQITATGNVDFGVDKDAATDDSVSWYGVAGAVKYAVDDQVSVAGRAEFFADPDGFRTGVAGGQNLIGITATPAYKVGDHVVLRADLRLDISNEEVFDKKDGETASNQFTFGLNALAYY